MNASDLPNFKTLPAVKGMPHGCAWGLFDKDGKRDNVGTLNLLTPEVILAAKGEIRSGISVSVNWQLNKIERPGWDRKPLEHKIIDFRASSDDYGHDDEIQVNTQSGSQWDGLKHHAYQATGTYYNGLVHKDAAGSTDNGIHHWNDRGGIVGRGVLLDYVRYAEKQGIKYDVMSQHVITIKALEQMAKDEGIELKPGDILLVRSGFTKWYNSASEEDRDAKIRSDDASKLQWTGVECGEKAAEWFWDHHFAAVAGDSISFEAWPFGEGGSMHQYFLAFWGMPIGEIWDLEKLAKTCEQQKRWSFFFTSAPLNIIGGVASPPNALCIL